MKQARFRPHTIYSFAFVWYNAFMKARFKVFFIKHHIVFYGIICLVANVLAVLSTNLTNFPLPDMEPLAVWQAFLARHRVLVNSLSLGCYLVPVVCASCIRLRFRAATSRTGRL